MDNIHRSKNALIEAILSNNKVEFETLIQRGINVNFTLDRYPYCTPLHKVAERNNVTFARMLIDAGADVNVSTGDVKETPLHKAAEYGAIEVARLLLDAGADINATDTHGKRPLEVVLESYHRKKFNAKLFPVANVHTTNNDKYDYTPFHKSESGKMWVKLVRLLLDAGANINATGGNCSTPLHLAGRGGIEVASLVFDAGADINATDEYGNTPLHEAARYGIICAFKVVRLLVDAGAVINVTNTDGNTPLHLAIIRGNTAVARILIEAGADIDAINKRGERPLHLAFKYDEVDIINLLFNSGVDVNFDDITKFIELFPILIDYEEYEEYEVMFRRSYADRDIYLPYIVMLKCLGLHVSEENMSYLRQWFNEELRMFEKQCEIEVVNMKRHEIREGYRFNLCDVLTKGEDVLRRMLQVREVRLKPKKFKTWCPTYESMICMKLKRNVKTIKYTVKAKKIIGFIVNSVQSIPEECVDKIASYFTDKDMKDLVSDFKVVY